MSLIVLEAAQCNTSGADIAEPEQIPLGAWHIEVETSISNVNGSVVLEDVMGALIMKPLG
jgi:hypothetical protein